VKWVLAGLIWFWSWRIADATTLVVSEVPGEIDAEIGFEVKVDFLTSSKNTTYYLAGVFYKTKGSNLFGLTEVAGEWIPLSASPISFFPMTTSEEGSFSGKLRVKADVNDEGFDGEGIYSLRIDRFTCKSDNPAESSNVVEIKLKHPPPPTPTPLPTPQPTPKATAGTATPTPKPTPQPTPTPTPRLLSPPTPTPSVLPTIKPKPSPSTEASAAAILGIVDAVSSTSIETVEVIASPSAETDKTAPTIILIGSLLLTGGIIPLSLKLFPRLE